MAFETYLTHDKAKPRKSRRITYALSLGVHGLALAIGVAGSWASVEELAPKTPFIPIVFSAPPPPSALGSDRRPKPKTAKTTPKVKAPSRITQPIAQPVAAQEPADAGDDDGLPPGDPNGLETGIDTSYTPPQPTFLPPKVAKGQLAIDPQSDRHRARLPPALARVGTTVALLLKICVDREGNVLDVKVLKSDDATAEPNIISAVRTWRYTPYKVDGRPVPFCTTVRYEVRATN